MLSGPWCSRLSRAEYLFIKVFESTASVISGIEIKYRKSMAVYSTDNYRQPRSRDKSRPGKMLECECECECGGELESPKSFWVVFLKKKQQLAVLIQIKWLAWHWRRHRMEPMGQKLAAVWKVTDFIFKFELEELLMRLTGSGFLWLFAVADLTGSQFSLSSRTGP